MAFTNLKSSLQEGLHLRRHVMAFYVYALATLVAFAAIKLFLVYSDWNPIPGGEWVHLAIVAVLAILGSRARFVDLPSPMKMLLGFIFASFAIYLAFPLTLPADSGFDGVTEFILKYRHVMLPALILAGFWRPSLGALGLVLTLVERITLERWLGENLSATEFFPLAEVAIFLVIAAAIHSWFGKTMWLRSAAEPLHDGDRIDILSKMTLLGICIHLANYFYSGVQKLLIGHTPVSWMLFNHTENLIPVHLVYGQLPLSIMNGLPELAYMALGFVIIPLNLSVVVGQLLSLLSVLRISWIRIISGFYDLTHVVIFLVSGIFFYKWILLNIAIIVALAPLRGKLVPRPLQALMVVWILAAPAVFFVAHLAWWDAMSFNKEKIVAVTDDGREIEIPTNYWGSFSVSYAQQRRSSTMLSLLFPYRNGTTKDQDIAALANRCEVKLPAETVKPEEIAAYVDPENEIRDHILIHHRYVLQNLDSGGRYNYDIYPHHIWSTLWGYDDFAGLDMRKVVSYRFIGQAICVRFEDRIFKPEILREIAFEVPVR